MKRKIRAAAIQTGLHLRDSKAAVSEAESIIRAAAEAGAGLVCLPEHWLASRVLARGDRVYERFSRIAAELKISINLGGIYEKDERGTHLVSVTLSKDGTIAGRQEKVHLYRRERSIAQPGSRFRTFSIEGIRIGVLVCHDLVFPESARTLALRGAEMILVPSLILARGTLPWHIYLKSRALENRTPIVSPNVYLPPQFLGESNAVDLEYAQRDKVMELRETLAKPGKGFLLAEFDLDRTKGLREERLAERRREAYEF